MTRRLLLLGIATMTASLSAADITYVKTRRVDHVDIHHGTRVPDPYRWLEDDVRKSKPVTDWVEAQNKVTFGYLKRIPDRQRIRKRLETLWNYEKFGAPFKRGSHYYFYKNDGLQNQSVLYAQATLDSEPVVLIDPNTWSKDGTVALSGTSFSDDGRFVAYGVAEAGSDWRNWRIMEIDGRRKLSDELKWIKFSSISWTKDNRGFFYSRFDEPREGAQFQDLNLNQKVYYHR
ncbi:MAG: S9 family peptidase, partial [Planctomycetaceae bacterium]